MKNSRDFYSTVQKKFGAMPFNLRSFDSETKAKMGVVECVTHKLVEPFQVLHEKDSKYRNFSMIVNNLYEIPYSFIPAANQILIRNFRFR